MNAETIALVRQSWGQLLPLRKQVCGDFYRRLFATNPELRPLFTGDLDRQAAMFVTMINTVISALDRPTPVLALIETLGARHADYGVQGADYAPFEAALLDTLAAALGADFTPATRAAWVEVYRELAATMQAGAADQSAPRQARG